MGLSLFSRCEPNNYQSQNRSACRKVKILGNPNPSNYEILKHKRIGRFLVVLILYPDCNNYEGKKILVYENTSLKELRKQEVIDPHFCDHLFHISPIARFVPSDVGWEYAINFCKNN